MTHRLFIAEGSSGKGKSMSVYKWFLAQRCMPALGTLEFKNEFK